MVYGSERLSDMLYIVGIEIIVIFQKPVDLLHFPPWLPSPPSDTPSCIQTGTSLYSVCNQGSSSVVGSFQVKKIRFLCTWFSGILSCWIRSVNTCIVELADIF